MILDLFNTLLFIGIGFLFLNILLKGQQIKEKKKPL